MAADPQTRAYLRKFGIPERGSQAPPAPAAPAPAPPAPPERLPWLGVDDPRRAYAEDAVTAQVEEEPSPLDALFAQVATKLPKIGARPSGDVGRGPRVSGGFAGPIGGGTGFVGQPGAYDPATGDSGGAAPGATAMAEHWAATTGLGNMGIYNYRPIRGGVGLSVHSEGRAVDLAADANDPAQAEAMDRYLAWLQEHADELGVQQIIWNRADWRPGDGWTPYGGVAPHTDHAHVELNRWGAANPSPLWRNPGFGTIRQPAPRPAAKGNKSATATKRPLFKR